MYNVFNPVLGTVLGFTYIIFLNSHQNSVMRSKRLHWCICYITFKGLCPD